MSCRKPNLQNPPRDSGYRACFVPAPGNVLIKADYSQIELRIAAKIAHDEVMLKAFRDHQDLHTLTASSISGKQPQEVTKQERQLAKAVNFGLIYGMGAKRLVEHIHGYGVHITEAQATKIRRAFFAAYRGLDAWHQRISHQLRQWDELAPELREARTILGRRRCFNGQMPKYTWLLNSPVQGSGADGLKLALAKLWQSRGDIGAFPVLVVHDEIVIEAPQDRAEQAKAWLEQAMREGMAQVLKGVPVEVEAGLRHSWAQ